MKRNTIYKMDGYEIDQIDEYTPIFTLYYNPDAGYTTTTFEVRVGLRRELVGAFGTYTEAIDCVIDEQDHHYCY